MRKLRTILQYRYTFKVLLLISIIYIIIKNIIFPSYSQYNGDENKIYGYIKNYSIYDNYIKIYLKGKENIIVNYYYNDNKDINNINIGDKYLIYGHLEEPSNNTIPNTFNYKKYLKNKKIFYIFKSNRIELVKESNSILYYIKNNIYKRVRKIDAKGYILTFLLGDKSLIDKEIYNIYKDNGISHLLSISSLHISIFMGVVLRIINKISYSNFFKQIISIIFILFLIFIIDNSISLYRVGITYIIHSINRIFNLKISRKDILIISFIILVLLNSMIIYDMGFQFSYIISSGLIIYSRNIKNIKNKLQQRLIISISCFLLSLPICIYYYYQINIFSIILNIIFIPFISIIIIPLCILTFIFPFIYNILSLFINLLEYSNQLINSINIFTITFCKPNIIIIIIYYLIIYLIKNNYKYLILLIIVLCIHKLYSYYNPNFEITYLDVGQADSIIIKYPHNKKNIMIDTGGIADTDYLVTTNKTIPYLRSIGIIKINILILTHGDYDHMGEAINLVNNFKVEKVIFNCGPYNDLEKDLIKELDKKKIKYYSCIKELHLDQNKLYFLQTKEYDNENDNSNVIYTELNDYKFMFMGDASSTTEKEILDKYSIPDIDVLKVGHHGSKTSSSKEFINEINPKYSVISVGKNNRYGHPNKEALDNLEKSKIYRTDQDGSIMFKIKNNRLQIETCNP